MKNMHIAFSPPDITEEEIAEVTDTLRSGWITTGPKTKLFEKQIAEHPEIKTIYIVTDSEPGYREMIAAFEGKNTYQLYRDYLDNFRINTGR